MVSGARFFPAIRLRVQPDPSAESTAGAQNDERRRNHEDSNTQKVLSLALVAASIGCAGAACPISEGSWRELRARSTQYPHASGATGC
jgi:hypothetical protein